MISLIVNVRVKPGRDVEYENISREFGQYVEANRAGNILFRTYRTDDPLEFVTIEHFEDEASLKAHQAAEDTTASLSKLRDILDGDLKIQIFSDEQAA